jgi:hypothetical protein
VPEWGLGDSRTEEQKAMIAYRSMLLDFGVEKAIATDVAISAFEHKPLIVEFG